MRKVLSVVAITMLMAGSTAFACAGCGCEAKKADKEKSECSSCEGEKKQTACGGSHKADDGKKAA